MGGIISTMFLIRFIVIAVCDTPQVNMNFGYVSYPTVPAGDKEAMSHPSIPRLDRGDVTIFISALSQRELT